MLGRQAHLPVDVMHGSTPTDSQSPSEYAVSLKKQLTSAYETVQHTCKTLNERQKELYDQEIHGDPYVAGDWVWVLNPKVPKKQPKNFSIHGRALYNCEKISECVYRIQSLNGARRLQVVQFNRLKPCRKNTQLLQPTDREDNSAMNTADNTQERSAPTPIGTNLQLIVQDNDDISSPQSTPQVVSEQSTSRHYPVRQKDLQLI